MNAEQGQKRAGQAPLTPTQSMLEGSIWETDGRPQGSPPPTTSTPAPTILILATHTGGGHLNLARGLQDRLEAKYNVVIVDPQPASVDHWYAWVSRHSSLFLTAQYTVSDNAFVSFCFQRIAGLMSSRAIQKIIEQVQPQLIIATHAFLSYAAARANERCRPRVPLVFQLTDLGELHMTWFTEKHAAAYLAPTREIFAQALAQGIERDRLHLTGRPLRRQFSAAAATERSATLAALGLDPGVFTVFLQGGAKGSAGADRTIERLLSANAPMQIILAVGNNKSMATRYAGNPRVYTLPYTEMIAPYMSAADVIAGKAGASFISEAFRLEKPFLVTAYIPGQETANLRFIEQHNLGWICLDAAAQTTLLTNLARDPAMLADKVESIRGYNAWNEQANQEICPVIDQLLASTPHRRA